MLNYSCQDLDKKDFEAVLKALKEPVLTGGKTVELFEKALCEYTGAKYACVCNSATSALQLAYTGFSLSSKLVLTTPISFVATASTALLAGARVEFVDVKKDGNIDEEKLEARLRLGGVGAVCTVDYSGNPVEYGSISKLCKQANIPFISDASHALGSKYRGQKVGKLADATIFSFHPIKPITTLEGGAILCDDLALYQRLCKLRSHGMQKLEGYMCEVDELGFNYRLSDVACALGLSQLKRLDETLAKRQAIVSFYDDFFKNCEYFDTIKIAKENKSSNHLYPLLLKPYFHQFKKTLFSRLLKAGISVQVHYRPIYEFAYYKQLLGDVHLEGADSFYKSELSFAANSKMDLKTAKLYASILLEELAKF